MFPCWRTIMTRVAFKTWFSTIWCFAVTILSQGSSFLVNWRFTLILLCKVIYRVRLLRLCCSRNDRNGKIAICATLRSHWRKRKRNNQPMLWVLFVTAKLSCSLETSLYSDPSLTEWVCQRLYRLDLTLANKQNSRKVFCTKHSMWSLMVRRRCRTWFPSKSRSSTQVFQTH